MHDNHVVSKRLWKQVFYKFSSVAGSVWSTPPHKTEIRFNIIFYAIIMHEWYDMSGTARRRRRRKRCVGEMPTYPEIASSQNIFYPYKNEFSFSSFGRASYAHFAIRYNETDSIPRYYRWNENPLWLESTRLYYACFSALLSPGVRPIHAYIQTHIYT